MNDQQDDPPPIKPVPDKLSITVVVNGTPTEVAFSPNSVLRSIVAPALEATGNSGQPAENWELRDVQGNLLDLDAKNASFHFPPEVKLFLSLKAGIGG